MHTLLKLYNFLSFPLYVSARMAIIKCSVVETTVLVGPNEHSSFHTTEVLPLDDGHAGQNM
jgi:hypothetical protein